MRQPAPHTIVLSQRLGWQTRTGPGTTDVGGGAIRLTAQGADAPLSLDSADGSLGGLLLPRGFAFDRELRLLILVRRENTWFINRYDPAVSRFRPIDGLGGRLPTTEGGPRSIAVTGSYLCVADPDAGAVVVFDLDREHLMPSLAMRQDGWYPIDIARCQNDPDAPLHILSADGTIVRWRPGDPAPRLAAKREKGTAWERIAVDREDRFYVRTREKKGGPCFLGIIVPPGQPNGPHRPVRLSSRSLGAFTQAERIKQADDVRDRFDAPWIRLWVPDGGDAADGVFYLPCSLAAACRRHPPSSIPAVDPLHDYRAAMAKAAANDSGRPVFGADEKREPAGTSPVAVYGWDVEPGADRVEPELGALYRFDGMPTKPPAPLVRSADAYNADGQWFSAPLDSGLFDCQWDRLVIDLDHLPAGASVTVSTFTTNELEDGQQLKPTSGGEDVDYLWSTNYEIRQPRQSGAGGPHRVELLVQSRQGRYLYLRLKLHGGGADSPAIRAVRASYPRRSYLELLPPVFSADDASRWFLERYLSSFQTTWDRLRHQIHTAERFFMPSAVPDGPHLRHLSQWLAVPLQTATDSQGIRRLLEAARMHYPARGTLNAVRGMLKACLANLTGGVSEAVPGYPAVVEGFRERHRVVLSQAAVGGLDGGSTLWGATVTDRLKVGVYARVGEARIKHPGDDVSDYLARHANSFTVYVPACWIDSQERRRLFRHAIASESPGQAEAKLCLVEPKMRVGLQSTVGLDTIVGTYPVAATAEEGQSLPTDPPRDPDLSYQPIVSVSPPPVGAQGNPILPRSGAE